MDRLREALSNHQDRKCHERARDSGAAIHNVVLIPGTGGDGRRVEHEFDARRAPTRLTASENMALGRGMSGT